MPFLCRIVDHFEWPDHIDGVTWSERIVGCRRRVHWGRRATTREGVNVMGAGVGRCNAVKSRSRFAGRTTQIFNVPRARTEESVGVIGRRVMAGQGREVPIKHKGGWRIKGSIDKANSEAAEQAAAQGRGQVEVEVEVLVASYANQHPRGRRSNPPIHQSTIPKPIFLNKCRLIPTLSTIPESEFQDAWSVLVPR
jgi:hypothetical protein